MSAGEEWLPSDDPRVVSAADAPGNCGSCKHWSRWLTSTGDCLFHAYTHREQLLDDVPEAERLPRKSARMTSIDEGCEAFAAPEAR